MTAVMTRRILQAKGLDPQKDITLLTMDTHARLQSLVTGKVAGGMMAPPSTYLAQDQGFKIFGRGRDYMRYLQTGVVATDAAIKQKRGHLVRFLESVIEILPGQPGSHASLYSEETLRERCATCAQNV